MKHHEFDLQKAVCRYLDAQYPEVFYLSDTIASLHLTIPQKVRNSSIQKKGFHCPDLLILKPNKNYHGLFIELKIECPYKKNGEIKASKDDHLKNQRATIMQLNKLGYYALFAWEFYQIKEIIDNYLNDKPLYFQP